MDDIPRDELIQIFHRVAQYVRLVRVRNAGEIKARIKRILDLQRMAYRKAKRGTTVKKFRGQYLRLRRLYRNNIHVRIWNEAVDNPGGIIDETLDYGYDNAQKRALKRARQSAGKLERLK